MERLNCQLEQGSHWSKQEACISHATQVWLAINHNTSITSDLLLDYSNQCGWGMYVSTKGC